MFSTAAASPAAAWLTFPCAPGTISDVTSRTQLMLAGIIIIR
jgi:hypothetical protein